MSAPVAAQSPESRAASAVAVAARDLIREYKMGTNVVRALAGVTLEVPAGEFACLLGSSGSGKSTLLNLIAGLDQPSAGAITVFGRPLHALDSRELAQYRRDTVGMVFQSFNLIPSMTIEENIELPMRFAEVDRGERPARVRQALERVRLTQRIGHRPTELSGGEQQRVAIARALVNRPQLLLADEPTGNLDSRTGAEIMELLRDLNQQGTTVLLVTHERALAERFGSRLLFLADGKLAGEEQR
jgi:putative ABC transport system ATP-binding protein